MISIKMWHSLNIGALYMLLKRVYNFGYNWSFDVNTRKATCVDMAKKKSPREELKVFSNSCLSPIGKELKIFKKPHLV